MKLINQREERNENEIEKNNKNLWIFTLALQQFINSLI